MITASLDVTRVISKLRQITPAISKNMNKLIDQQVKLFISDPRGKTGMMQLTPPSGNGATGTAAKKRGEAAVMRDIDKVYATASETYLAIAEQSTAAASGFWFAIMRDDITEAQRILAAAGGRWRNIRIGEFDKSYHAKSRSKKTGKVSRHVPAQVLLNHRALQKYIREKRKQVGYLASGWSSAASKFGASVPVWISRHSGTSRHRIKKAKNIYQVTLSSHAGFQQGRTKQRARYAMSYRINAIERRYQYIKRQSIYQATR